MNTFYQKVKRRVLPVSGVISTGDYLRTKRVPKSTRGAANVSGVHVEYADRDGFLYSVKEIFKGEVYKFETKSAAPFIVDAGANIGISVIYFKSRFPNSHILAFEPDPTMFELLDINVRNAGYQNVELRNSAVWIEDTSLIFYKQGSLAGSTTVDYDKKNDTTRVNAERLKTIIKDRSIDFLKLDIEGAENKVLFDIEDQLPNVKFLFFEYHSVPHNDQMLAEMLAMVKKAGFRVAISGTHGPKYPFIAPTERAFDLQMNVSCFR